MRPSLSLLAFLLLSACQQTGQVQGIHSCSPLNCGGCCDDRGQCVEGKSDLACGYEGVTCAACSGGSACQLGECMTPHFATDSGQATDAGVVDGGIPDSGIAPPVDAGMTPCPPDGWCFDGRDSAGLPVTTHHLRGVWAISPNDVWAVGDQGTVIHFDGQAWTPVSIGASDDLMAIWASGPNDVWVSGGSGDPSQNIGVILRFDGTTWNTVKRGIKRIDSLWGSGPSNVWAVGTGGTILRWDGTQLLSVASGTSIDLTDVSGLSMTQAWAVGASGLLLKWDGTSWQTVPTTTFGGLTQVVPFSASLVWAVGGNGAFLRFNGSTWTTSNLGMNSNLLGLWAASPTAAWGVGPAGELEFFDGSVLTPKVSNSADLLRDVHGSDASHVWAVGFNGVVLRYRP